MYYVGLDVHMRKTSVCILDDNGKRVKQFEVRGPRREVIPRLMELDGPFAVCFEASCGYGYLHGLLWKIAKRVVVAHPGQLRLIFRSKRKNDRLDAEKLAKLLFLGEVPTVYVPSANVRAWRALIEYRSRLIAKRTRTKNTLRALLRGLGIEVPAKLGLWTKLGRTWLASLQFDNELHTLQRDMLLDELLMFNDQIRRLERQLHVYSQHNPAIILLRSIPGVGPRTSEAIAAYIDDPDRFHSSKSIGGYLGLVPSQDQSGSVNRLGHITREGPATVRRLLTEAAWQAVRRSPRVRAYFERIAKGAPDRRKIALVATAHYLARVMLAMLKRGEFWQEELTMAA
jgi:transposase